MNSLPRQHNNQLCYVGGETKIFSVDRNIKFAAIISKLSSLSEYEIDLQLNSPRSKIGGNSILGDGFDSVLERNQTPISSCYHSRGVYHRDLKPENLLLDQFRRSKVGGFAVIVFVVGCDDVVQGFYRLSLPMSPLLSSSRPLLLTGQILAQVKQVVKVGQGVVGFGRNISGLFKHAITVGKEEFPETPLLDKNGIESRLASNPVVSASVLDEEVASPAALAKAQRMSLSQPQKAANSLLPQLAIDASKPRQSNNASGPSTSFTDSRLWEVARTCNITVNLLLHHLDKILAA
ncbi:hypothetical protein ACFX2B_013944 [Malus domestica]